MSVPPPLPTRVLDRVRDLLDRAAAAGHLQEPAACTLGTAGQDGRPSSRTVLLKGVDERGFVFYTNLRSRKSRQIQENPWATLTFFWQSLFEQIQVEGPVEQVPGSEADAYWVRRPRESQIGAWASAQSEPLADRSELEESVREYTERYRGQDVPRPGHWSGYRVLPERLEFWTARDFRLHDRECWTVESGRWTAQRLHP